jgi:hypothetical protein
MNTMDRVLGIVAGTLLLLGLAGLGSRVEPAVAGLALASLATSAIFVLLAFGLAGLPPVRRGGVVQRLGLGRSSMAVGVTLALACGTLSLSNVAETLIALLGADQVGALAEISSTLEGSRGAGLLLALVSIGLVAGASEEIFFRGLVQRALERRLAGVRGGALLAVLTASLAFALAHWDPVHSPAAFFLGLYLGAVTWLTGSVRPAIVCHVVNNLGAVLSASFGIALPGWTGLPLAGQLALAAGALALAWRLRRSARSAAGAATLGPFPGGPSD